MGLLDREKIYKKFDTGFVAQSIEKLPDQISQVASETGLIKVPLEYGKISQIVINGMGGSNVGAGIIKSVFAGELKVPINITPGYQVPAYVDKNTLYLLSSYSGNTEEPLSVLGEVKKKKAKILAITANPEGTLARLAKRNSIPAYITSPRHNPSGRPNYGIGYSITGMLSLLAKIKLFEFNHSEIRKIIADLRKKNKILKSSANTRKNPAKQIAQKLSGKKIIVVAAEFLTGNLRVLRNQLCENGKNFASYLTIPELNHYAMEGLSHPLSNQENLVFLFLDSSFYHPRIKKRSSLTKDVVRKNKIKYVEYKLKGSSKLEQSFELLQLGSWISYYLAILNKENPSKISWVDYFKKKLA